MENYPQIIPCTPSYLEHCDIACTKNIAKFFRHNFCHILVIVVVLLFYIHNSAEGETKVCGQTGY